MDNSVNQRIKILRKSLSLNQSEFSRSIEISHTSLSHIESERNKPGFDIIFSILSKYEHVSSDWLILGKGEMKRENTDETYNELFFQFFNTHMRVYQLKLRIEKLTSYLIENGIVFNLSDLEIKTNTEMNEKWEIFIKTSFQTIKLGRLNDAISCVNEVQTFHEHFTNHFLHLYDQLIYKLKGFDEEYNRLMKIRENPLDKSDKDK